MSLNAHDRHALAQIEEDLVGGDPKFAAKLSGFSRLADGEEMPESERIRQARRHVVGPALRGLRPGRPGAPRLMYWIAVAMAVALTLAVICFALVLGNTGGKAACTGWQVGACARRSAPSAPAVPSGHKDRVPSFTP
ncbi:MAG: DUF3040 domain-containing protein [Trebonia sp.]